jgi:hypothetical protein
LRRGGTVGVENLGHHEVTVFSGRVGYDENRLKQAVRRVTFGLLGGRTVEGPLWGVFEFSAEIINDQSFTPHGLGWLVSVQPDVF